MPTLKLASACDFRPYVVTLAESKVVAWDIVCLEGL